MSGIFDFIGSIIKIAIYAAIMLAVMALFGYNQLRALSEAVKAAFSNIGVTARKQVSLTNQLIEAVKGYADTEKFVHLKISDDISAANIAQIQQQSHSMVSAINGLAQRYPDLKSSQQYNTLMEAIYNVENDLERQRERFNEAARAYNTKRTSIPHVFYAAALGFRNAPYLELHNDEPQDMGMLNTMNNDDGERVKQMLGAVGSQTATVLRTVSNKAVEHGKVAMTAAQTRMKQQQVMEYSYLDQDRNPQGPVSLDALLQLQAEGKVTTETPVMPLGGRVWAPLGTVINPGPAS
ncbi:LemA protein [Duganella sp. 3397]|uniref:LemA family protein n=1 Tax=Duganella sp. 3397 TaxID=2817732 RepID=UPI002865280B|nr:LemA family protein [Duganella sp. 3397]MDR7048412.1 LemA protein [Duganella sp. 3397]